MPDDMRKRWEGKINHSSLELAARVVKLNGPVRKAGSRKVYSATLFFGSLALLLIFVGIDLREWMKPGINRTIAGLWIISSAPYVFFDKAQNSKRDTFEKHRHMLVNRIKADFCTCSNTCKHREEFMLYMKENYDINVYY